MAKRLTREHKIQLGELIGAGHRHFGKVMPRRPYAEDEGGGAGTAQFLPDHPLLARQPLGATSDLTFIVNENKFSIDEAEKRSDELNPALRKALENKLGQKLTQQPPKTPEARMY